MRWMERTGASISGSALKHSLLCPVSLPGVEQGQLCRCPQCSWQPWQHSTHSPSTFATLVGDPRASPAGLGCT